MYQSFKITNFRCFDALELNDLGRVNLIAGKNNTGKSSLLEAVHVHANIRLTDVLLRERSDFEPLSEVITDMSLLFNQLDAAKTISLVGKYARSDSWYTDRVTIEVVEAAEAEPVFSDMGTIYERSTPKSDGEVLRLARFTDDVAPQFVVNFMQSTGALSYEGKRGRHASFAAIYLPSNRIVSNAQNAARFSNLEVDRNVGGLLEALKIIEPRLGKLSLIYRHDPPTIYGDIGLTRPIPLAHMGEGIGRVTSLVLAIGNAPNGVVLIDEIENGLHYSVMTDVWRALDRASQEFNAQIFATTHSLEAIRAAHEAFSTSGSYDFRLHRLDRTQDGSIRAVTYDQETLAAATDMNLEVR